MEVIEVNSSPLFERLKDLELKTWRGLSEIKSLDILRDKKAYIFQADGKEVGYLIYSLRRKGEVYIEDLVVNNPTYFISVMLLILKLIKANTIVALVEPTLAWLFSERMSRILRREGYKIEVRRSFKLFKENTTYVRLVYEGSSCGR